LIAKSTVYFSLPLILNSAGSSSRDPAGTLGFKLTEEFESTAFGKPLKEQRYDLVLTD